jgi:hypothetical protein
MILPSLGLFSKNNEYLKNYPENDDIKNPLIISSVDSRDGWLCYTVLGNVKCRTIAFGIVC